MWEGASFLYPTPTTYLASLAVRKRTNFRPPTKTHPPKVGRSTV